MKIKMENNSSSILTEAREYLKHYKDGKGHYISVYRDSKDGKLYAEGDVPSNRYTVEWDNDMAEHCEIDLGFQEIKDLNPSNINLDEYEYCSHADGRDAHWHLYRKIVDGKGKWVAKHQNTGEIREINYDQARGFEPIDNNPIARLSRDLGRMLMPRREAIKEGWQDDWVEPTINKTPVDNINGLNIYKGTDQYGEEAYYLIDEDDDNPDPNYYEWQTETLDLAREWASSYEIDEEDWYIEFSDEEDSDELTVESNNLNESLYGYFDYTRTGPRNKPIYSLVYGNHLIAKYDKNDWSFVLGAQWERHIDKLIEWLSKYYPGFFIKKRSEDSVDYCGFVPTSDEAVKYIKDKKITILSENLCIHKESRSDYREPIKCLQNNKGDYINVYKDKETGKVRAEGNIIGSSFHGPWSDEHEEYYKNKGFKEVEEEVLKENFYADNKDNLESVKITSLNSGDLILVMNGMYDVGIGKVIRTYTDSPSSYLSRHGVSTCYCYDVEIVKSLSAIEVGTQYSGVSYSNQINRIKNPELLTEASYGGAFDIEDDQFFTRDDLNEFSNEVEDIFNDRYELSVNVSEAYIDNNILDILLTYGDFEYSHKEKINMRRIKKPSDLKAKYASIVATALYKQIEAEGDLQRITESSKESDWEYVEEIVTNDPVFGDMKEGNYHIKQYNDDMIGHIYPPHGSENIYRAELRSTKKLSSPLAYEVFSELHSAKNFLDKKAAELSPVSYADIKQQLEEIDTHDHLKIFIDEPSQLNNVSVTIEGTLINGDPITFYDSSFLRTQRDIDFIKSQYEKAAKQIDDMREAGYLGVKEESVVESCDKDKHYIAKETSYDIAEEIAQLAKKDLKLNKYDTEMLHHDINNLRANEWVDSFAKLGDGSKAKQMFFKYAVQEDPDYICEGTTLNESIQIPECKVTQTTLAKFEVTEDHKVISGDLSNFYGNAVTAFTPTEMAGSKDISSAFCYKYANEKGKQVAFSTLGRSGRQIKHLKAYFFDGVDTTTEVTITVGLIGAPQAGNLIKLLMRDLLRRGTEWLEA